MNTLLFLTYSLSNNCEITFLGKNSLFLLGTISYKSYLEIYSLDNKESDFYAENIRIQQDVMLFDFIYPAGIEYDIEISVPGIINIENTVAAFAVAVLLAGVSDESIEIPKRLTSSSSISLIICVLFELF